MQNQKLGLVALTALALTLASCSGDAKPEGTSAAKETSAAETSMAPSPTPEPEATPNELATFDYPIYSIGQTFEFQSMRLTVNSVEITNEIATTDGDPLVAGPGEDLVLFKTHYTNLGNETVDLSCSGFTDMWLLAEDIEGREMPDLFETYRIPGNPECNYQLMSGQEGDWNFAHRMIEGSAPLVLIVEETTSFEDRVGVALQLYSTPIPAISGAPVIDQTLSAVTGTWEPAPVDLTYQWFSGETAITGATGPTYVTQPADLGTALKVTVTGSKSGYTSVSQTSSPTDPVEAADLTDTPTPTIDGPPEAGATLTAVPGDWGPQPLNFTYQWYRGTTPITGATTAEYVVQDADVRNRLKVAVTGSKDGYNSETMESSETDKVSAP